MADSLPDLLDLGFVVRDLSFWGVVDLTEETPNL